MKCVYWLNDARSRGLDPETVIDEAQTLNHSARQSRAPLVEAALLRNLDIAGKLGCLTSENLVRMRHGTSPVISRGPYAGSRRRSITSCRSRSSPPCGNEIANLELLPRTLNRRKGARMGERQRDYLEKFREADLVAPVANESEASEVTL